MLHIKDLDLLCTMCMNDKTLFSFCQVSRRTQKLSRDENFWRNRVHLYYPKLVSKKDEYVGSKSWKEYYLYLTYWIGKLYEDLKEVYDQWSKNPKETYMDSMDHFIFWKEYYADVDYYEQHHLDIEGPLEPESELVEVSCEE